MMVPLHHYDNHPDRTICLPRKVHHASCHAVARHPLKLHALRWWSVQSLVFGRCDGDRYDLYGWPPCITALNLKGDMSWKNNENQGLEIRIWRKYDEWGEVDKVKLTRWRRWQGEGDKVLKVPRQIVYSVAHHCNLMHPGSPGRIEKPQDEEEIVLKSADEEKDWKIWGFDEINLTRRIHEMNMRRTIWWL